MKKSDILTKNQLKLVEFARWFIAFSKKVILIWERGGKTAAATRAHFPLHASNLKVPGSNPGDGYTLVISDWDAIGRDRPTML